MADYLTDEWIAQQQQRLDAAHEQVAQAIALFERAGDSLPRLEAALQATEERVARLRAELEQARAGFRGEADGWLKRLEEEGKAQALGLGQRLSEILKDLEELRDQRLLWELRERVESLRQQWSATQDEWLEALREEVAAAEARVQEPLRELSEELRGGLEALRGEASAAQTGLRQELGSQLDQLREWLGHMELQIGTVSQGLEQEARDRQELTRALDTERSAREALGQELRALQQAHAQLQGEFGAQLQRQQELERQLQGLAQTLEQLGNTTASTQQDNATRLDRLERHMRSLLAWFSSVRGLARLFRHPQEVQG
jgi:chromosome segregation ATPase